METTVKQRIIEFLKAENIRTSVFEKKCGFSNGYLSSLKDCPSAEKLTKILEEYPKINKVWLLAGEGPMLNEGQFIGGDVSGNVISGNVGGDVNSNAAIVKALEINQKSQEQIDRLLAIIEKLT